MDGIYLVSLGRRLASAARMMPRSRLEAAGVDPAALAARLAEGAAGLGRADAAALEAALAATETARGAYEGAYRQARTLGWPARTRGLGAVRAGDDLGEAAVALRESEEALLGVAKGLDTGNAFGDDIPSRRGKRSGEW